MFLEKWKEASAVKFKNNVSNLNSLLANLPFLRSLGQRASSNLVGIDFEPNQIKLLRIDSAKLPYRVENFAITKIPTGLITKDEIKDYSTLGTILKEMFKEAHVSTKLVAVAIPRSLAIIKNITIDSRLNEEEIESRAWIEANRHFPDLVGDIHLDFTITGPSVQDPSQLDLILVACRKDQIKPYLEVLKQAGLTPKIVDVNCYALERALTRLMPTTPSATVALLNLNFNLSSFIVVHKGQLLHAHDQSYDGERLMNQIQAYLKDKNLNVKFPNNEELCDEGFNAILKENLISHLRHTLHFFYSSRPNVNIQQMVLAGDCSMIPCLTSFINKEMGIETVIANPFDKLTFAPAIPKEELMKNAPALMLCCGLALST